MNNNNNMNKIFRLIGVIMMIAFIGAGLIFLLITVNLYCLFKIAFGNTKKQN